jgi:alanyl-tRNA synthetase
MTGDVGFFKIITESAVAANVRRIEALTGKAAVEYVQSLDEKVREAATILKTVPDRIADKITQVLKDLKQRDLEVEALKAKLLSKESSNLLAGVQELDSVKLLVKELVADSPKELREYADRIKDKITSGIIVLGSKKDNKVMLICVVTKDLTDRFKAGEIIKRLSEIVGGKGGGRPDMAQGGGSKPEELDRALESVRDII